MGHCVHLRMSLVRQSLLWFTLLTALADFAHAQTMFKDGFEARELPFQCSNTLDDDGDGLTDCGDPDCFEKLLYSNVGGSTAAPAAWVPAVAQSVEVSEAKPPFWVWNAGGALTFIDSVDKGIEGQLFNESVPIRTPVPGYLDFEYGWQIFMGMAAGYLYQIPVPGPFWTERQIWRQTCTSDSLLAEPIFQSFQQSNAQFQQTIGQDLIMVPTYHGCGDQTRNQVLALPALNIQSNTLWRFNIGDNEIDAFVGCILEYASNTLYCTSETDPGQYQNNVWAISTLDGSLKWAAHVPPITTKPALLTDPYRHLMVVSSGVIEESYMQRLHAFDADTGHEDWSLGLTIVPGGKDFQPWAESRPPFNGMVYVVSGNGKLHGIYDGGTTPGSGISAWTSDSAFYVSAPVMTGAPSPQIFAGRVDGMIGILDPINGSEAHPPIQAFPQAPAGTSEIFLTMVNHGPSSGESLISTGKATSLAAGGISAYCTRFSP